MKHLRNALVWRGILAVALGVISVAWPNVTIGAVVLLFAASAFIATGSDVIRAFSSDRAGSVAGRLLLALVDVAAGLTALLWPSITALSLVWLVAVWAFVSGFAEFAMGFQAGETAGERALFGLGGLVSIALGVSFAIRPDIGALTIAQVFGLFSLFSGISTLVLAANTTPLTLGAER